jgi:hypothetical protein
MVNIIIDHFFILWKVLDSALNHSGNVNNLSRLNNLQETVTESFCLTLQSPCRKMNDLVLKNNLSNAYGI